MVTSAGHGRTIGLVVTGELSQDASCRVLADVAPSGSRDRTALEAAFDRLYDLHRDRVYGFLVRLSGGRDRADDLFQETWLRVARAFATSRRERIDDEEAWLFRVARNVFLSERRASSARARAVGALALEPERVAPSPERIVESRQATGTFEAAFAGLAEEDRTVLWLVAAEGLELRQVALVLGIGYAAVRQRVSRARARLSSRLAPATVTQTDDPGNEAEPA